VLPHQRNLFGHDAPAIDPRFAEVSRVRLDEGAWVDHLPGWVRGHERLFEALTENMGWRSERRPMYERVVDVPRLLASVPEDGAGHPVLEDAREALSSRYGASFESLTLALYRDGRDSVAWHGDRVAREMAEAIVATVSLGEPRRFLLRPASGGPARTFKLGWGDLLVMGGSCQRTWRHAVPKAAHAHPRLAIMFRPAWFDRARY
jgi:alkylated DNA repair dioxygenase AlkB